MAALSPIAALQAAYTAGTTDPADQARRAVARTSSNASHNSYISVRPDWTHSEAARVSQRDASGERLPLYGVPVALKDCFDLDGFATSSGSKFYAAHLPAPREDSWVAARLRATGAVITGKTHLHQLAYGITGENPDYGDCLQPANAALLTGGSSSGSAAAVQEGSAFAAIGTDTGGSIRTPAALCGLAGYRASLGLGDWRGGWHLSETFDTIGWLFRDLRDAPLLAEALFDLPNETRSSQKLKVGVLSGAMLDDCDDAVRHAMSEWEQRLAHAGAATQGIIPEWWRGAWDIYAPIQAQEAARIHAGSYERFAPAIAARLAWGASLSDATVATSREQHTQFRARMDALFANLDFILAPATPVSRLAAGADHTEVRALILHHTTPGSLGGNPALVLPGCPCGVQLMAAHADDGRLLRFGAQLGDLLATE
ncbi:MAG TPA: amidase [Acidobacteriaceae bacterium]|nr:amidase [Acidobacteriaceae bacterium]